SRPRASSRRAERGGPTVHNAHAGVPGGTVNFRGTERFQLLRCIGRGGMGIVYEALDLSSDTRVALKRLPMVGGELFLRFKTESRALADLHTPTWCGWASSSPPASSGSS